MSDNNLQGKNYMIKITDKNREKIIRNYAQAMMNDMNWHTMKEYAFIGIISDLMDYTDTDLENEITHYYPNLLEK